MRTLRSLSLAGMLLGSSAQALEWAEVDTPAAPGSLAPSLVSGQDSPAVLSWLEATETGHRLLFSTWNGAAFDAPRPIAEGDDWFANWADTPGLAILPNGTWLAHWRARSGHGPYAYDIQTAFSTDRGLNWTAATSPHRDGTPTEHGFVSTYAPGDGQAGLVWLDGRETRPADADRDAGGHGHGGGAMTLRTTRIDAAGDLRGATLLDGQVCDCCGTAAAYSEDGVVVVYRDRSDDEIRDIYLVRQDPEGWSRPVPVHEDGWRIAGCPVNGPAALARGQTVIVAWFTMADDIPRVRMAMSRDAGRSFGEPTSFDAGDALGRVHLAWLGDDFAMSWMSQPEGRGVVRLARFNAAGELLERSDLLPLDGGRGSGFPRLLALDTHRLLVAWTGASAADGIPRVRTGLVTFDPPDS